MVSTLLDALRTMSEAEVVAALEAGSLELSGNFRGREEDLVADYYGEAA